jgi:uncharacterized protein involved in exopolysaccharide biosynthesis
MWERKWLVTLIVCLSVAAGGAYALLATEWFQADVVVAYAEKKGPSGSLAQLGGLASLAGISVGTGENTEPLSVLKSRGFARRFIEDENLQSALTPRSMLGGSRALDIRDAVDNFDKNVRTVTEDKKASLIVLSIRWTDPAVAAQWANTLVRRINSEMQREAENEASRNLQYLQTSLVSTTVLSLQQAIGRLMESELQKAMLAKGNSEYAFKVIDAAVPPKHHVAPKRLWVVAASGLLGAMASALLVYMLAAVKTGINRKRLPQMQKP